MQGFCVKQNTSTQMIALLLENTSMHTAYFYLIICPTTVYPQKNTVDNFTGSAWRKNNWAIKCFQINTFKDTHRSY